jgi:hypothetical protein
MLIGVDFDNTIVSYDRLFHTLAFERGLIPAEVPASKGHVRDYLRAHGREEAWIELQGLGYGSRMAGADLFPGVAACLREWLAAGLSVAIVSHKTRQPYSGQGPDLQEAAHAWLEAHGFYAGGQVGLGREHVHFELTKQDKVRRIATLGCDWFVDDLPEFLGEPGFPVHARRVLFDPADAYPTEARFDRARSWAELQRLVPVPAAAR